MKKFIFFFVLPGSLIFLFFSGGLPYTLVSDEETLNKAKFMGDEPITAEVVTCNIQDTKNLHMGSALETTFRVKLHNHTDRFVWISTIGEVFSPTGHSAGMHSKWFILNPNASEENEFRTSTVYTRDGRYKCEMRYNIGRYQ